MQSQLLSQDGPWPRQASMDTEDEERLTSTEQYKHFNETVSVIIVIIVMLSHLPLSCVSSFFLLFSLFYAYVCFMFTFSFFNQGDFWSKSPKIFPISAFYLLYLLSISVFKSPF